MLIRGADHLNNARRQLQLIEAMGARSAGSMATCR